jgi:hypothetical protein
MILKYKQLIETKKINNVIIKKLKIKNIKFIEKKNINFFFFNEFFII